MILYGIDLSFAKHRYLPIPSVLLQFVTLYGVGGSFIKHWYSGIVGAPCYDNRPKKWEIHGFARENTV